MRRIAKAVYATIGTVLVIAWPLVSWADVIIHQAAGNPSWWNFFRVLTEYGL